MSLFHTVGEFINCSQNRSQYKMSFMWNDPLFTTMSKMFRLIIDALHECNLFTGVHNFVPPPYIMCSNRNAFIITVTETMKSLSQCPLTQLNTSRTVYLAIERFSIPDDVTCDKHRMQQLYTDKAWATTDQFLPGFTGIASRPD